MASSEELIQIISAEETIKSNTKRSETIRAYIVGAPLYLVGELFKEILSWTLGFKWLLKLSDRVWAHPSLPQTIIILPTVQYKVGTISESDEYFASFVPAKNYYYLSLINFPLVFLNYIARNLGKIIGWLLVSPWTIPAHVLTKAVLWTANSYYHVKSWWNLKKVDKVELAAAIMKSRIPNIHEKETLPYLTKQDILTAAESYFTQENNHKNSEYHLKKFYKAMVDRQLSQKRNWKIGIAIGALLLTPLSLLVSVPLYRRAMRNNAIVRKEITWDEYIKRTQQKTRIIQNNVQKLGETPTESAVAQTSLRNSQKVARKVYSAYEVDSKSGSARITILYHYQYSTEEQLKKQAMKDAIRVILTEAQSFNASNSNRVHESFSNEMLNKLEKMYGQFSPKPYWGTKIKLVKSFLIALGECTYKCGEIRKAIFYMGKLNFSAFDATEKTKCIELIHNIAMNLSDQNKLTNEIPKQKNDRIVKVLAVLSLIPDSHCTEDIQTLKVSLCVEVLQGGIVPGVALSDLQKIPNYANLQSEVDRVKQSFLSSPIEKTNMFEILKARLSSRPN